MNVSVTMDSFGRIVCDIQDEGEAVTVTSADADGACAGLLGALDAAQSGGMGECVWPEGGGEYRWMLRRDGNALTVVVLWSRGTLTGWQHVFWSQARFDDFNVDVRRAIARLSQPAGA